MSDTVRIDQITTFNRLRPSTPKQVDALAGSILEVGLLNPITVAPSEHGFALVAGLNRLDACRSLGWEEIPAVVLDLDEQRRIIAECDENLYGSVLTPAERAVFLARRKEAYEALHPETAQHVAGGHAKNGSASDKLSFAEDAAAKTGRDVRTIQRDASRGEKVSHQALNMVQGTKLDTGAYLDALKKLTQKEQIVKVKVDLSAPVAPKKASAERTPVAEPAEDAIAEEPSVVSEAAEGHDPDVVYFRKVLANLTREGLEDEVLGLRADNVDLRKKVNELEIERDDLKEKIRDYQTDNLGASVGKLQRQCDQMRYARDEAMKTAKREEYKRKQAEKRVSELQDMGIPLN